MNRIFSFALLGLIISAGALACKKADLSGNTSDSNTASNAAGKSGSANSFGTAEADKDKVLSEVTAAVREYINVNDKGDLKALERILANDFQARWQGKIFDKNGWMDGKVPSTTIASDEISNIVLAGSTADTATLHFDRRLTYNNGSAPFTERDSISLVKRDGQWQIKEHISGH